MGISQSLDSLSPGKICELIPEIKRPRVIVNGELAPEDINMDLIDACGFFFIYDIIQSEVKMMCGRFTVTIDAEPWLKTLGIRTTNEFTPRYNVAPGQEILTVGQIKEPCIIKARWGLIPPWAKEPSIGYKMINARAETLREKASFRNLLTHHRCLIPADGFYEWQPTLQGKVPFRIVMKDRNIFAFAGLWTIWVPKNGEPVTSCTIITTQPNCLLSRIHDRMPLIISPDKYKHWLKGELPVEEFMAPFPEDLMEAYPVSSLVNSPKNDVPEAILALGLL